MHPEENKTSDWKNRCFYGAAVGAILGMIIGTMPGNDPILGLAGIGIGATLIAALTTLSKGFWESLLAAWELVRISFWRW